MQFKTATDQTIRKVRHARYGAGVGGSLAAAVVSIIVWAINDFTSITIPAEVGASFTTLMTVLFTVLGSIFGAQYFGYHARPDPEDKVVEDYGTSTSK